MKNKLTSFLSLVIIMFSLTSISQANAAVKQTYGWAGGYNKTYVCNKAKNRAITSYQNKYGHKPNNRKTKINSKKKKSTGYLNCRARVR